MTSEDRDGMHLIDGPLQRCWSWMSVSSTKACALSIVLDMAARTVKVFPKPMSSARMPPRVSCGLFEILELVILFSYLQLHNC